jgi:hypothetical protein
MHHALQQAAALQGQSRAHSTSGPVGRKYVESTSRPQPSITATHAMPSVLSGLRKGLFFQEIQPNIADAMSEDAGHHLP